MSQAQAPGPPIPPAHLVRGPEWQVEVGDLERVVDLGLPAEAGGVGAVDEHVGHGVARVLLVR